jgi:hypothetical protein
MGRWMINGDPPCHAKVAVDADELARLEVAAARVLVHPLACEDDRRSLGERT